MKTSAQRLQKAIAAREKADAKIIAIAEDTASTLSILSDDQLTQRGPYIRAARHAEDVTCSEVARALAHVGLFTRVGLTEGVSGSHVVQVAKGQRSSKRILAAIIAEVRRIDACGEQGVEVAK